MIVSLKKSYPAYRDYGITIPILYNKVQNVLDAIYDNKELAEILKKFHYFCDGEGITQEDILRVHDKEYVARLYGSGLEKELIKTYELIDKDGNYHRYKPHEAKYPLTKHFQTILAHIAGGYFAAEKALAEGFCYYLGGGMHHAKYGYGEGFCVVHDILITLKKLMSAGKIRKAWVIDVDAHKGDGTASLTSGDDSVITLDVHMAHGWPLNGDKFDAQGHPNPSFVPADINIPINKGDDGSYNILLKKGLDQLGEYDMPDLALVVNGADPYEGDELESSGDFQLNLEQLFERDKMIYEFLKSKELPQVWLMAGGYGKNSWRVYAQFLKWLLLK